MGFVKGRLRHGWMPVKWEKSWCIIPEPCESRDIFGATALCEGFGGWEELSERILKEPDRCMPVLTSSSTLGDDSVGYKQKSFLWGRVPVKYWGYIDSRQSYEVIFFLNRRSLWLVAPSVESGRVFEEWDVVLLCK